MSPCHGRAPQAPRALPQGHDGRARAVEARDFVCLGVRGLQLVTVPHETVLCGARSLGLPSPWTFAGRTWGTLWVLEEGPSGLTGTFPLVSGLVPSPLIYLHT